MSQFRRSQHTRFARFVLAALTLVVLMVPAFAVTTDQAEARADCNRAVTSRYDALKGLSAHVITKWCFDGKAVRSRESHVVCNVSSAMDNLGWRCEIPADWAYSWCHRFNNINKHNCLTRKDVMWRISAPGPLPGSYVRKACLHTRIYGNGAFKRASEGRSCSHS